MPDGHGVLSSARNSIVRGQAPEEYWPLKFAEG